MEQFEKFGLVSNDTSLSDTEKAGRYEIQEVAEKYIIPDILTKLEICPEDRLLDVGCNLGLLTVPLSYLVTKVVGIDNGELISTFRERIEKLGRNIELIPGDFLDVEFNSDFNKILVYSVVPSIGSFEKVIALIDKVLQLLPDGGMALIADIPNVDYKKRFLESKTGKSFSKEWEKLNPRSNFAFANTRGTTFTDKECSEILYRVRKKGFNAYLLPQNPNLPFGNTREDLIIKKPL